MSALVPAAAGPRAYWFLTRGTGAVALVLLTASVVLGVLGSVRFNAGRKWPRFTIDALHRDVSLLVLALLVLHIVVSVLDSFAPISLLDAVIPFRGVYRPLWLGLGALSFDLLIALVLTSLLRRRLGYRSWRAIHWLAYASWPVAVFHGLGTGSDTMSWWMLALTGACVVAVLIAVWVRVASAEQRHNWVRAPVIAASAAVGMALVVFTAAGPLQHGWARRSGTPTSLLAPHAVASAVRVSTVSRAAAGHAPRPFSATLSGTISQQGVSGGAIVDMVLNFTGGEHGILRVRLAGAPEGGGLSMTGSQVDLTAVGLRSAMAGQIVSLDGSRFDARVKDSSGAQLMLHADLNIDDQGGTVTGSLVARRA